MKLSLNFFMSKKTRLRISIIGIVFFFLFLLLTVFAGTAYYSSLQTLDESNKIKMNFEDRYKAESVATDIISTVFAKKQEVAANLNGISNVDTPLGKVKITSIDGHLYFSVPLKDNRFLYVEAIATSKDIEIIKWFER